MINTFNIATRIYIEEAKSRGIDTEVLYPGKAIKLTLGNHVEYCYEQLFSNSTAFAYKACENKAVTNTLLKKAGLSVALGKDFAFDDYESALTFAKARNFHVVLKPTEGKKGDNVYIGFGSKKEFDDAWNEVFKYYHNVLIEEVFIGEEYRIFATAQNTLAITCRRPANITGDGIHSIRQLIDIKNQDPRRSSNTGDPVVKIKIDQVVVNKLKSQNLDPDSVPKKGEFIYLRNNSNVSTGGESVNITNIAHPNVKEICRKAIAAIPGLPFGGVDFMTGDITKAQDSGSYIIVEINSSPGIDLHHYPYEGDSIDVAATVIDDLFPETRK